MLSDYRFYVLYVDFCTYLSNIFLFLSFFISFRLRSLRSLRLLLRLLGLGTGGTGAQGLPRRGRTTWPSLRRPVPLASFVCSLFFRLRCARSQGRRRPMENGANASFQKVCNWKHGVESGRVTNVLTSQKETTHYTTFRFNSAMIWGLLVLEPHPLYIQHQVWSSTQEASWLSEEEIERRGDGFETHTQGGRSGVPLFAHAGSRLWKRIHLPSGMTTCNHILTRQRKEAGRSLTLC